MAVPERYWLQLGRDATSEMFVFWQSATGGSSTLEYRISGAGSWTESVGSSATHPFTGDGFDPDERLIHKCSLSGLTAGSTYEFRFPGDTTVFRFWTLPSSLSGGSVTAVFSADFGGSGSDRLHMSARFANYRDPYFVVLSGDWAYADGLAANYDEWDELWAIIVEQFTVADNRVIPLVPGIGNHEVVGGYSDDITDAPYFYAFFDMPNDGAYYEVTAGSWLSLVVIDSEHTAGNFTGSTAQETWLASTMAGATETHKIGAMHVPFYPGSRDPDSAVAVRGETYIAPLFEDNGYRTVFVGHDHIYHRTLRIHNSAAVADSATGTRYFGEGGWGAAPRSNTNDSEFYVDEIIGSEDDLDRLRHGHVVTFAASALYVESVGRLERWHCHVDPPAAPSAPANATGVKALAASQVVLSWDDVLGASGYRLYRNGNLYSTVYRNELAVPRGYTYTVSAFNDNGESSQTTCALERCA